MTVALEVMRSLIGTAWKPGDGKSSTITGWLAFIATAFPNTAAYCNAAATEDYFSWCGLSVGYCMAKAGIAPVFGPKDTDRFLWAQAWLEWGSQVATPQPGDVLVFNFGGGDHHVSFYEGDAGGGRWYCLGGNQSHEVNISSFPSSTCMGIRRPPSAGTQPIVIPSQPLSEFESGRGSWYSQYSGKYEWIDTGDEPGSAALGVPDDAQGVAFYNRSTLGQWFEVRAPNGATSIEQQTDIGPSPSTGRLIDISAAAAERFGYSPGNFPTDSTFEWRPVDPPSAVAGLSPQQQAAKYRDLRSSTATQPKVPPMPDQIRLPPPQPSRASSAAQAIADVLTILEQNPQAMEAMKKLLGGAATAASGAVTKAGGFGPLFASITSALGTGGVPIAIIGWGILAALQAHDMVGTATGNFQTPVGGTTTAGLATTGILGVVAWIKGAFDKIASAFGQKQGGQS